MSSGPLVSIITSCYNHEPYLDDYVNGLLNQSYPDIELILFDDGSTDRSWAKIKHYLPKLHDRFRRLVVERHDNIGCHEELVLAMDRAEGEYICHLESDDYYLPSKIAENVKYLLSNPDVGVVHSDADFVYGERIEPAVNRNRGILIATGDVYEALLRRNFETNFITTSTTCCRASLLKAHVDFRRYALKGYLMGDFPMWLDLSRHTSFGYIDQSLARYRILPESATRSASLDKVYRFWSSYMEIKRDYMRLFPPSTETARLASKQYYEGLCSWGFRLRAKKTFFRGYRWLVRNYPGEYGTFRESVRASSVHHDLLWTCVLACQQRGILGKGRKLASSLRETLLGVKATDSAADGAEAVRNKHRTYGRSSAVKARQIVV